ncbi:MAG: glycosyltransferase family 1 protein [Bradyrhizobiaceae bacterium]|nr:MAG: glycosyltransferase family 1 protein [Bradyrhizobiaceae bacterium]
MPKLLYLVTEDWFFVSHFLPMARAARAAGLEVVVATRLREQAARIAAEGFRTVSLESERRSLGPIEIGRSIARMAAIVRAERPDIVHCIALRMVALGGLAAKAAGARALVLAPTGLGHLWIENGPVERIGRAATRAVVGRWLRGPRTRYLFENRDDPREFGLDPDGPDVTLIGGAGVAADAAAPTAEPPAPPLRVAVVSRMLRPKGIAEAVAAVRRAREIGAAVELSLYGTPDPSNRRSCSEAELRAWSAEPGVAWRGRTDDVAGVWRGHHVAMLLSYREGTPRSLVEAAAAGRPIVATDVPGCREVVRDGIEGLLVPARDTEQAAQALVRLAGDAALRARMGAAAHARFRAAFTEEAVGRAVTGLYRELLAR